jgi:hypothetical protein
MAKVDTVIKFVQQQDCSDSGIIAKLSPILLYRVISRQSVRYAVRHSGLIFKSSSAQFIGIGSPSIDTGVANPATLDSANMRLPQ